MSERDNMRRNPQVVISSELHKILRSVSFASDVPIYKLVDAILRPVLKDPEKLKEAVMHAKSKA